jgi:hypothetical protein
MDIRGECAEESTGVKEGDKWREEKIAKLNAS